MESITIEGVGGLSKQINNAAMQAVCDFLGGYKPGFELVEGASSDAVEQFIVIRKRGLPGLLLPTSQNALRVALSGFIGVKPWTGLISSLAQIAVKFGLFSSRVSVLSLKSQTGEVPPFRQFLTSVLERDDYHLALRTSFGRPNAKIVIQAVSHDGSALCFVKVGSEKMSDKLVAHESEVLVKLEHSDLPILTPRTLYQGVWEQRWQVLITEPMLTHPLDDDATEAQLASDSFTTAGEMTTCALRDSEYWRWISGRIDQLEDMGLPVEAFNTALARIDAVWGSTELDFGASHGDWSRANVGIIDGQVAAYDWERYSHCSPRGTDIAHFSLFEFDDRHRGFDVERVAEKTRQNLKAADRPEEHAQLLVILGCLEMSLRFMSAQKAGVQAKDKIFGQALEDGLRKWAT